MAFLPKLLISAAATFHIFVIAWHAGLLSRADFLIFSNIASERRVREHDIEAIWKNSIDIKKPVVIMNSPMAVSMHDHIHFACARCPGLGINTKNTIMRKTM